MHLSYRNSIKPSPHFTPEIADSMLEDLLECVDYSLNDEEIAHQRRILEEHYTAVVCMIGILVYRCCDCPDFPRRQPRSKQLVWLSKHFSERVPALVTSSTHGKDARAITEAAPLIIAFVLKEATLN